MAIGPVPEETREAPLVDLGNAQARARISAGAFRAFRDTADYLGLSISNRCRLLGDLPQSTFHRWVEKGAPTLPRDTLERISLVLGIVKALRLLFASDEAGKRWLFAPNTDAPFAGASPAEHMLRGSIAHLYGVRRYLDSWRGVWP
ncbi:MAG TPA: MbcA/ParS/Xre antitoxin family protein [Alphaproteobacteria bacterium]|nr:MbcA/ParS/Xre antitoxin family protein [Alphaproteobacteria bacterium]